MSLDDESLLSGYIDGQLDPEQNLVVDSAIGSDARTADKLRSIHAVHELVAGLSRPTPVDLSAEVVSSLRMRTNPAGTKVFVPSGSRLSRSLLPWAAGIIAAAASVGLYVAYVPRSALSPAAPSYTGRGEILARGGSGSVAGTARSESRGVADRESIVAGPAKETALVHGATAGLVKPVNVDRQTGKDPERVAAREQQRVRALLDDPSLRRIFLVTDVIGETDENRVSTLVRQATQKDSFRISVTQGIVIDPDHPDQATVFAFILQEDRVADFRKQLENVFDDKVQEPEVDPAIVTQLADIGDVVSLPPHPVGEVVIPPDQIALKLDDKLRPEDVHGPVVTTLERMRSTPGGSREADERARKNAVASRDASLAAKSKESSRPDDPASPAPPEAFEGKRPVVVLVWVSHSRSG